MVQKMVHCVIMMTVLFLAKGIINFTIIMYLLYWYMYMLYIQGHSVLSACVS